MFKGIFFTLFISISYLSAQILVGSGYTAPAPVSVAPGQIATFYVAGLPNLVGLSATLQQNGSTSAPIQSARYVSLCPDQLGAATNTCGSVAAVTVQIPYSLVPQCILCAAIAANPPATLQITQNGQNATAIELNPLTDEVHVLTACDVALGPPSLPQPNLSGLPCAPLVTHVDGSLVSAANPANVGESVTIWVFGLGQTNPPATTGAAAKMAPAAEPFHLDFNYSVNALPTKPFTGEPDRIVPVPLFAGLAPGYVGLYQVNFTVPAQPPNGTPRCTAAGVFSTGSNVAQANFTVSIGGQYSFDGAGICVATQIPID